MPLLVGGGCGGGRLVKSLFVTGVCLFILYCYFYFFEFKPDDLTVVFPTRRSKTPVLPSLLGGGGGAGSAAPSGEVAPRSWLSFIEYWLLKCLLSLTLPTNFPQTHNYLSSVLTVNCLVKEPAIPLQISFKY